MREKGLITPKGRSATRNRPVTLLVGLGPQPIWFFNQLPPIYVGDIFAFKAEPGFEQWAVAKENALTWHWALAGKALPVDQFSGVDQEIIGSISKGVATELLSAYQYRHMRIYRPKLPRGIDWASQISLELPILKRCAYYGAYEYNWLGVGESAIEYFLKYLGIKINLPIGHRFYCIQFVARIWQDFNFPLVKDWEQVTPYDMEHSPQLELVWGTF